MNKNITPTQGNVAALVLHVGRAKSITSKRRPGGRPSAHPQAPVRTKLMMIWRTHPVSGRLECRWVGDNEVVTRKICKEVGLVVEGALLGRDVAAMSLDRLKRSFGEAPGMVCLP